MKSWFLLACGALLAVRVTAADPFADEHARWREQRVAKLTRAEGWLSLVGLHFLREGPNRVGRAKDNDIVLATGPAHVGTVTVSPDGKVFLDVQPGAAVLVNGAVAKRAELKWSTPAERTLVTSGTMTFFAVERAGRRALRVRDSESPRRKNFAGIDYFPLDPSWRIEARWQPFDKSRTMPVIDILGQTAPEAVAGKAVFERDGKTIELLAIDEGADRPLFFVISDATGGKETYGGGRHLYAARPNEGERVVVLDFNRAENPPCAFTPFSMCPVPPKENRMPFAIRVGEKTYRGAD